MRPPRTPRRQAGFSLMEVLLVALLSGLIVSAGVPSMGRLAETSLVDAGGAGLRSIWRAQRMYWLEHGSYTSDLRDLELAGMLDKAVRAASEPFTYALTAADATTFSATAVRTGSSVWVGTLAIDERGDLTGTVRYGAAGHAIAPTS